MTTKPPSDDRLKPLSKRALTILFRQLKIEFHALNDRQSCHEDQLRASNLHIAPLERMAKTERNFDALLARVNNLESRLNVVAESYTMKRAIRKTPKGRPR